MKTKITTIHPETYGRSVEELVKEVQSRISYQYLRVDGKLDLPFNDPLLYDVLVLIMKWSEHE